MIYSTVCNTPKRQYVIQADLFGGFSSPSLSIYDQTGKHLKFRLKSQFVLLHSVQLVTHPEKTLIGKLKAKMKPFVYAATFSVYDNRTKQWRDGVINQKFQMLGFNWTIEWHHHKLSMEAKLGSSSTKFYDTQGNHRLLAEFQLRSRWSFRTKYDMEIYSDEIPDSLYFLCLAVRHVVKRS
ncbi:unnamed protein product [Rotaria sp. Silwood2]|nr:unnamed protein product [Rotaria sp. Silwood2]CAF4596510.1 unnamed protein product [Rotaria sp. Silwood2]